ncbi:MAG: ABC transporter permease [Corynebacteriales bacterium]|nr:ABC transporter permease [Mycobacteriales bacterium]
MNQTTPTGGAWAKFVSLSRAAMLGFVREKTALFFGLLFPLMFLVLFGGIFKDVGGSKPDVLQIGNASILSQSADAREVLDITKSSDKADALEKVRKGDYDAAIEQRGDTLIVHYSAADAVKANTVQGIVQSVIGIENQKATGQEPKYSLSSEKVEDESISTIQYMTPGLLGWAISMSATFGAALTLVTWRQKKTLRRLRLAPVGATPIIASRVGITMGIALVQTALFIGVGLLPYFGLTLTDYWWMAFPLVLAGSLAFMSIGLVAGSWAKSQETASAIANLVILPMAFLSGSFFPLDNAPEWLQTVSTILPLTHLVTGMQDVMVRGERPSAIVLPLVILLGFTALMTFIASRVFRWDDV